MRIDFVDGMHLAAGQAQWGFLGQAKIAHWFGTEGGGQSDRKEMSEQTLGGSQKVISPCGDFVVCCPYAQTQYEAAGNSQLA